MALRDRAAESVLGGNHLLDLADSARMRELRAPIPNIEQSKERRAYHGYEQKAHLTGQLDVTHGTRQIVITAAKTFAKAVTSYRRNSPRRGSTGTWTSHRRRLGGLKTATGPLRARRRQVCLCRSARVLVARTGPGLSMMRDATAADFPPRGGPQTNVRSSSEP